MHRPFLAIAVAMLLAACDKPAPNAPVEPKAAPMPVVASAPELATSSERDGDVLVDEAIDQILGDHNEYKRVFEAFQQAVAAKDAAAVAALVDYPFTARIDGKKIGIADAAAFVAQYDKIVTPPIARAIGGQAYRNLFVNEKGVMFGKGEAWINGVCKDDAACKTVDVRVVAIQSTTR